MSARKRIKKKDPTPKATPKSSAAKKTPAKSAPRRARVGAHSFEKNITALTRKLARLAAIDLAALNAKDARFIRTTASETRKALDELTAALREDENRLCWFGETAFTGIVIHDRGVILDANDQYARLFGYKRAEIIGKRYNELIAREDRNAVLDHLKAGHTALYTYKGLKKNGAVIWVEAADRTAEYRGHKVRVAVVMDVSQRKKIEVALETSELRYRRLFETAQDGILILDADKGKIVDVNPFLTAMLGFSKDEVVGKKLWEIGTFKDIAANRAAFAKLQRKKYIRYENLPLGTKDGRAIDVEFVSNVYHVDGTEVIQCNIRDITARVAAAAAARRRAVETTALLKGARAVLDHPDFAGAARELFNAAKTAIGAAAGYVALLNEAGDENDVVYLDPGGETCAVDPNLPMPVRGLRAVAYAEKRVVIENDFARTAYAGFIPPGHAPLENVMFAPMVIEGKAVGLLGLANKEGGFNADDARLAAAFAELAGTALRNDRTTELLGLSEARYRFAQEAAGIGTWEWDVSENTIFWSHINEAIHGFAPGEFDGSFEAAASRLHPDDAEAARKRVTDAVAAAASFSGEYRVIWPDGSVHWLWVGGDCQTDAEGKVTRVLGVNLDVTVRKNAEDALRESEERLRRIVNASYAAIVLVADGQVVNCNDRITEVFGYEQKAVDGFPLAAFFAPEDGGVAAAEIDEKAEYDGAHRGIKKDGTPFWLRVRSRPLKYGGREVRLVYLLDITNLKDAVLAAEARGDEMAALSAAATAVLAQPDFVSAAKAIFRAAKKAVGADNGFVTLITPEGISRDEAYVDPGSGDCRLELPFVNYPHGLSESVVQSRMAAFENDFAGGGGANLPAGHVALANVLMAPLVLENTSVGFLALGNKTGGFTVHDLALADAFAEVAAVALHNFRARDKLRRSEERFRFAEEAADAGAYERDLKTDRVFLSPVAERLFGFAPGEFNGRYESVLERIHPDDVALAGESAQRRIAAGERVKVEYRVIRPGGNVHWLRITAEAVKDAAGVVERTAGIIQDVTDEKEAANRLVAREERYRFAQEAAGAGAFELNLNTFALTATPAAERLFGYEPGEFDGVFEHALNRVHGDDLPGVKNAIKTALAGDGRFAADFRIVWPDGAVRWLRTAAQREEVKDAARAFGIIQDVTEEKEAAGRLGESQAELEAIFQGAPVVMAVVDGERRVRMINQGGAYFAQRTEADAVGIRAGDVLRCLNALTAPEGCGFGPDCVHCEMRKGILAVLSDGREVRQREMEFTAYRDGGWRVFNVLVSATPLRHGDEDLVLLTLEDVTRLKHAQEALKASEERYALAQEAAGIGSWDWDIGSGDFTWTEGCAAVLALAAGDLGRGFEAALDIIHPEEQERVAASLRRTVETGAAYNEEFRVIRSDGSVRWIRSDGRVVKDINGKPYRMLGILRDVTSRRGAEEDLTRELELNRALAELAETLLANRLSVSDLVKNVLTSAQRLTHSEHGFVQTRDPATGNMLGHVASEMMAEGCRVIPETGVIFPVGAEGRYPALWGFSLNERRPFYSNEPATHEAARGLPEGHVPLKNYLAVPAFIAGEIVGHIAVANSPEPYDERALAVVRRLAEALALAIQRNRTEAALRTSESRYALAQRAASIGSWDWNIVTGDLYWSEEIEPMFGFGPGGFGKTYEAFLNCVHPEDRSFVEGAVDAAVERDADYEIEHRIVWPDGSVRWVSETGEVHRDDDGKPLHMYGVVQDVTERRAAAAALAEAELRYRTLFDQSPDGVLILDPETMLPLEFNDAAHRQLGYSRDEFYKVGINDYEALEKPENTRARVRRILQEGRDDFQTRHRTKTGEMRDVFVSVLLMTLSGRRVMYTIFRDITPLQRAEERLKEIAADLQRSNRELELFAYVASHDLQEPLRMVSGYMQLLERRYRDDLDADAKQFIAFAVDGARRMQQLIQDLLAYSRVGSRGKPLVPVDLRAVIKEVLANLTVAVEESGAVVEVGELPAVNADATQMAQLFQNLLSNALKFKGEEPPRVRISARRDDGEWVVAVSDNGIGIAPEHRERIFGVFQRLHGRGEYPGTGIGLAICEKIVQRHGGRIWAESEPGEGATFYFTLPTVS